jgi:hypothetical protein
MSEYFDVGLRENQPNAEEAEGNIQDDDDDPEDNLSLIRGGGHGSGLICMVDESLDFNLSVCVLCASLDKAQGQVPSLGLPLVLRDCE